MTETRDEIEEILANDCEIRERYIDEMSHTCAIGALALAAGVEKKWLRLAGSNNIDTTKKRKSIDIIRAAIFAKFPHLTLPILKRIQLTNDEMYSREDRRRHVIRAYKEGVEYV